MAFRHYLGKQNRNRIKLWLLGFVFLLGLSFFVYQQLYPLILKVQRANHLNFRLKNQVRTLENKYQYLLKRQAQRAPFMLNINDIQPFLHTWLSVFRQNHLKVIAFKPYQDKHQLKISVQLEGSPLEILGVIHLCHRQDLIMLVSSLTLSGGYRLYLDFHLSLPVEKWGKFKIEEMKLNKSKQNPFVFQHPFKALKLPLVSAQQKLGWLGFGGQKWDLILVGSIYKWNLVGGDK